MVKENRLYWGYFDGRAPVQKQVLFLLIISNRRIYKDF